jgi:hypothetical protein
MKVKSEKTFLIEIPQSTAEDVMNVLMKIRDSLTSDFDEETLSKLELSIAKLQHARFC